MSAIIWNVRGVASVATRRRLKKLIQLHQVYLLVLLEPFVLQHSFAYIRHYLRFDTGAQNESNKIWFFWNSGTNVTIIVDHPQFLHVKVEDPRLALPIYFTPVYASCDASVRRDLWAGLHHISLDMEDPWIVGGDFNVITHDGERTGHNTRDRGTTAFSDMMLDSGLEDAGFLGNRYTWTNGRVRKRLDRVLINSSAAAFCRQLTVKHLNRTSSDHSPLLLQWTSDDDLGPRPFRFLNRVRDAEDRVDEAEIVFDSDPIPEHRDILHQVQAALNQTLSIEEGFWKQRAGSRWVCEGDHNTRYFHAMVQGRRIRSRIRSIRTQAGEVLATPADIQTSVREAVFNIDADSVAGPDGFSSLFFQHCWDIIQEDVYSAVLDFFDGGHLPRGFAATSIVLLPKKVGACRWTEFRPISLCTVFSKIITKLLNTRLSTLLPRIISPSTEWFHPRPFDWR
ncbi:uncharacterized protein LOC111385869 [Olea europaea var. sylvestris]|uniref:uncharacterized protein LOC111385869 n=1 Tax=Olea europaea var. sylvestris TaxID=158386 RepID=UPI000C1D5B1E|nr:uncharacterized protein LOC111385869 [Olea europaea var. sylvestris]